MQESAGLHSLMRSNYIPLLVKVTVCYMYTNVESVAPDQAECMLMMIQCFTVHYLLKHVTTFQYYMLILKGTIVACICHKG